MAKSNKEIALEALKRAFIERDPTVVKLFASNYKRHNPVIPDGPSAIAKLIPTLTALTYEPGMAVAEGDLVMVHGRYTGWGPKPMVAVIFSVLRMGRWWNTGTYCRRRSQRPRQPVATPCSQNLTEHPTVLEDRRRCG
jgi:predicted SnoaL-like aldol condensation-catalyzing enzyme